MSANPYEPSQVAAVVQKQPHVGNSPMTVQRGFIVVVFSCCAFAVVGASLGILLATFAPGYYRTVFRNAPSGGIELIQLGFGLGITQGAAAGLIAGLVIVIVVAWFNSRKPAPT